MLFVKLYCVVVSGMNLLNVVSGMNLLNGVSGMNLLNYTRLLQ